MSAETSVPVVESKWGSALEYAVFGFPAMAGLAFLIPFSAFGGSPSSGGYFSELVAVVFLAGLVGSLVLTVVIATSLYFDAKRVRNAETEWDPSPVLYGLGGLLVSGLVALHYLYERYEHTASPPAWDNWWYGVAACLAVVFLAGATVVLSLPTGVGLVVGAAASASVLPIAIYKDAVHVRGDEGDWLPNPVNYFLATFVGSFLLVVPAAVGGYYLYKRHKHVGTP